MRLPKIVRVLGDKIRIQEVSSEVLEKFAGKDEDILGLALLLEGRILILKTIPFAEKRRVLYHEIFHFVLYKTAVSVGLHPLAEETLCQSFAATHCQLKEQGL